LGVPRAQRRQIELHYRGGVVQYVQDCMRAVFAELPLKDNYFWRVYIKGEYAPDCCPEYLTPTGFARLKAGLVERVSTHTQSVQGFLEKHDGPISKFVLLDHMDWLSDRFFPLLEAEWHAIMQRAAPRSRFIWRSGGLRTDFLNDVRVLSRGQPTPLTQLLSYYHELADQLHARDRVHTYASFYIADLRA
jgi:S-adenosylmethionine-diacylglycerol 3-amino-3-carboxypropyl transferase